MQARSPDAKDAVRVVGRYALHEAIASGGMATVHFGRLLGPVGFSRTVAIKRLHAQFAADPEFVSMFLDEARLAARIRHPNVIPTLDVVATSGELFLVMEYVPGESLARLARTARERGTTIPLRIISAVLSGTLHGLHAAHEAKSERGAPLGIVHRDVSPQNVLVGSDGVARVLDFGVAKAAGRMQTTREGQIKGKLSYMSPEQLRGKPVSRQCDIYAAGVLLWELLVGERLFSADNEGALLAKVLEGHVDPPSTRLNPALVASITDAHMAALHALDAVVLRAVATAPEQRFTTAREMAVAIERAVAPAMASDISEWLEATHADVLTQRAELVAEIESSASSIHPGPPSGSVQEVMQSPREPNDMIVNSRVGPAPTRPPFDQASSKSQMSSISVASATQIPGAPRRPTLAIALSAAAAATLAIVLAIVFTRGGDSSSDKKPSAAASTSAIASTPEPPATVTMPVIPTPEPSATTAPVASAEPKAIATPNHLNSAPAPSARVVHSAQVVQTTPSPPPPAAARDCTPPYTWDSSGIKHIKPNCL